MSNINNTPPSPPAVELLWPQAGTGNGTCGSSASAWQLQQAAALARRWHHLANATVALYKAHLFMRLMLLAVTQLV